MKRSNKKNISLLESYSNLYNDPSLVCPTCNCYPCSCKEDPVKTYKFDFTVRYPGGFEDEVIDTYEASSEEEARTYFNDKYPEGSGSISVSPEYFDDYMNDHPVVSDEYIEEESVKKNSKKIVKEDYDPSLPDWARKAISTKVKWGSNPTKRNDRLSDIAWDTVNYIQDSVPTSNRDPRLKDPNRMNFFKFANGKSVAVYKNQVVNDAQVMNGWEDWKYFSKSPWKRVVDNTVEFGYIDLTDPTNFSSEKRSYRSKSKQGSNLDPSSPNYRGRGQYKKQNKEYIPGYFDDNGHWVGGHEEIYDTYSWLTSDKEDKSGYKLDPNRLSRKLDSVGLNDFSKRLTSYYNKLITLKSTLADIFNNLDVMEIDTSSYDNSLKNFMRATDYLKDAINSYKELKKGSERILTKYEAGQYDESDADEYIKELFDWNVGTLRDSLKRAQENVNAIKI